MRSSEPRWGKPAKSFVSQLQSPEFSWVDDSLLVGSTQPWGMAACPSGKIAATEREGVIRRWDYSERTVHTTTKGEGRSMVETSTGNARLS